MILNIFYLQIENSNICFSNHVLFIFKTVPCPKNEGKKKSKDLIIEENKFIHSSDILFDGENSKSFIENYVHVVIGLFDILVLFAWLPELFYNIIIYNYDKLIDSLSYDSSETR